ncbi:MAG: response regulator [Candidatus Thiodiazotropha sp. (ex Lucinoma kastoroae)]|nr:response regulator [Candidatus Thiodiazotropha sp. (ex Lucinoma kastoroae)]MCU7861283.1 response regulator [Candidatus Thiodiazotropha sp. (ex Lucinoma kastoroae)]
MFQTPALEVILELALHIARQFPALLRQMSREVSHFLHTVASSFVDQQQEVTLLPDDNAEVLLGKKILLVDDDMRNSFALAGLLKKSGMQVELAAGGQQALESLLQHQDIDLVLMDIMMPEMDGYEATRKIREQKRFKALPIIALTAKAMPEDRQHCLDAGAGDYLAKQVDREKLFALMQLWLSK